MSGTTTTATAAINSIDPETLGEQMDKVLDKGVRGVSIAPKKLNVVGIDILFKKPKNSNFYITNNKGKKELLNNIKLIYKSLDKKNIF